MPGRNRRRVFAAVPLSLCLLIATLVSGCLGSSDWTRGADREEKALPGPRLYADLVYFGHPSGRKVDGADLKVRCALPPPENGRTPQCIIALTGLKAAGWQGIEVEAEAAPRKPETAELAAVAEITSRGSDGTLHYSSSFCLAGQGQIDTLVRHLKIYCYTAQGSDAVADRAPARVATLASLRRDGACRTSSLRDHYLIVQPLVVRTGEYTRVSIVSNTLARALKDGKSENLDLGLGLFRRQIGLIKNYGPVKSTDMRVQIPPDLPAGTYYFGVADREFHVNSGICYTHVKVLNPALTADMSVKPRYRLVAAAAPVYDRPGSPGSRLRVLPPGAVIKVLARKETAGEQWYWAELNVYESGKEKAGWLRAGAVVPITPENYRTARDVRLRPGACYYEHRRYARGDQTKPAEWNLPEEVLLVVERKNGMVRLRPSEDVSLAVEGDIWTAEENLVYFKDF